MSDRDRLIAANTGSSAPGGSTPAPRPRPRTRTPYQNSSATYTSGSRTGAPSITIVNDAGTTNYWVGNDGMIALEPQTLTGSAAAQFERERLAAWETLANISGVDTLGVNANWWPGLMTKDPFQWNIWGMPGEDHVPERWAQGTGQHMIFEDEATNQQQDIWVRYDPSRAAQQFFLMSGAERAEFNSMMVEANLIDKGYKGSSEYSIDGANAFSQVLSLANYYGKSAKQVLAQQAAVLARSRSGGGGRGGGGPTVKIEVPDYETMLADSKKLLEAKVAREVDDWEMSLVADHMKDRYGQWVDAKKRSMLGGNGTYEIPDPNKLTERFVEKKYADELSRLKDTTDTQTTNRLLLDAATKGIGMVGGLGG